MKRRCLITLIVVAIATSAAAGRAEPECVRIDAPNVRLVPDPNCTMATHPLAATALADQETVPDACVSSTYDAVLTTDDGRTLEVTHTVYGALTTNRLTDAAVISLPSPLFDGASMVRILVMIVGADIVEVRSKGNGRLLGQLAARTTGWAEIDTTATPPVPKFLSERLVITHGGGRLFKGVGGEYFTAGDAFGAGVPLSGSICGEKLARRVRRAAR
jgi:hypothetical protein